MSSNCSCTIATNPSMDLRISVAPQARYTGEAEGKLSITYQGGDHIAKQSRFETKPKVDLDNTDLDLKAFHCACTRKTSDSNGAEGGG
ncbi:hypothetical protein HPT30_06725 [Paenibacillus sp. JW14]|uniref:Uncharacterized protein n=1 Tax=Paenibacillus agri TaxID=2744309 RepID=A0A850EGU3_9BACL|nr:hypothetical protein [Paenibacillus agri]NUU60038.1 hypothetical protein [Paenibacillus agri]